MGSSTTVADEIDAEFDVTGACSTVGDVDSGSDDNWFGNRDGSRFLHLLRRLGKQLSHLLFARAHWQLEHVPDLLQRQHAIPEVRW